MKLVSSRSTRLSPSRAVVSAGPENARTSLRCAERPWITPFLLTCFLGCARSAVPSLDPDSLTAPALPGLSPRTLDVRVVDQRPVSRQDRVATEQVVANALGRVLATRGVAVESEADNRLFITVQQPESRSDLIDPASCIEVQSELAVWGVSSPAFKVTRCSTWSHGGAASGSGLLEFEGALDHLLGRLDAQLATILQRFAPPSFDPERIESPNFDWLQPREVALSVSDQVSTDGTSGTSLERALENVFRRSGISRAPSARYRLAWSLRRPAEPRAGANSPCIELSLEAHDGQGTFRSAFETCSGSSERLVNGILDALNAHGKGLQRPAPRRRPAPQRQPQRTDASSPRSGSSRGA
jgi:hypothetical protein